MVSVTTFDLAFWPYKALNWQSRIFRTSFVTRDYPSPALDKPHMNSNACHVLGCKMIEWFKTHAMYLDAR